MNSLLTRTRDLPLLWISMLALSAAAPAQAGGKILGEYLSSDEHIAQSCKLQNRGDAFCSATVIGPRALLTAAHCKARIEEGIRSGTLNVSCHSGEFRSWRRFDSSLVLHAHPGAVLRGERRRDVTQAGSDLMLLELVGDSKPFKTEPIAYVGNSNDQSALLSHDDCRLVGWGRDNHRQVGVIRAGKVGYLWQHIDPLVTRTLSYQGALAFSGAPSVAAGGDSGGSLLCKTADGESVLVGVISASSGDAHGAGKNSQTIVAPLGDEINASWLGSIISGT